MPKGAKDKRPTNRKRPLSLHPLDLEEAVRALLQAMPEEESDEDRWDSEGLPEDSRPRQPDSD